MAGAGGRRGQAGAAAAGDVCFEGAQRGGGSGSGTLPKEYANTAGCLFKAAPDTAGDVWTELLAPGPGVYRVAAKYQLPRGTPCPEELTRWAAGAAQRP